MKRFIAELMNRFAYFIIQFIDQEDGLIRLMSSSSFFYSLFLEENEFDLLVFLFVIENLAQIPLVKLLEKL